jgi:phospholipid/cholesterol/gamma-HCH transport system substrate-binding protein
MISPRDRDRLFQRAVGLLVLASLLALLAFARSQHRSLSPFEHTQRLHTVVGRADGIASGAAVTLAGLQIGRVEAIELTPDNRIRLALDVDAKTVARLRADAVATVLRPVLGAASIEIDPGSADKPLAPGEALPGRSPPDFNQLVASLPERLAKVDATLDNLEALSHDLRQLSEAATTGRGSVAITLAHLQSSARQAEQISASLSTTVGEAQVAVRQIGPLLAGTGQVIDEVGAGTRQLAPVLSKVDTALDDLLVLTRELRATAPHLPALATSGRHATQEADELLSAARRSVLLRGSFPEPVPLPQLPSPR